MSVMLAGAIGGTRSVQGTAHIHRPSSAKQQDIAPPLAKLTRFFLRTIANPGPSEVEGGPRLIEGSGGRDLSRADTSDSK